jgi:hypothetical protein
MINANELRIGNLVEYKITDKFDERKEWWEVSKIDADDIHWLSKVDTNDDDFRAIPLTEEWLLKCGFVENCYQDRFENKFIHVQCNKIRGKTELWIENIPHIKYLHQLQNLYFALTGEELQITP